jgi:hypothetical protein
VRWDFESDGSWDTAWGVEKVVTHEFPAAGMKAITLEVRDPEGAVSSQSKEIVVSTTPIASFVVEPDSGTTATVFQVDASASSDAEDPVTLIQVRWDWEDDGSWDTPYAVTKTATHRYMAIGRKTIRLEARDSHGLVGSTSRSVVVGVLGDGGGGGSDNENRAYGSSRR